MHALALLLLIPSSPVQTPEKVLLKHTYLADAAPKYRVIIKLENPSINSTMEFKVKYKDCKADGTAKFIATPEKSESVINGDLMEHEKEPLELPVGPTGFPDFTDISDQNIPLIVWSLAGILPNKEVTLNEKFTSKHSTKTNFAVIDSTGTLTAIEEVDKRKVWKVSQDLTLTPQNDDPGDMKATAWFDAVTGELVKADGTISVQNGPSGTFTIERLLK